jgi:hypothetical protein
VNGPANATGVVSPIAPFVHLPPLPGALAPASPQGQRAQDVGHLFPAITPPPAATPSPGASRAGQVRHQAPAGAHGLLISEPLTGNRLTGLIVTVLVAAVVAAWLLLGNTRRRRVP